jgi:DNA-binding NarL/FixJ family response regulator
VTGATGSRPRVFLVDDHHLFRSGVRAELGDQVDVVGEASDVDAAIEMFGERLPDVVLVDVHMPDGGGRAVIATVLAAHPQVRFLALSVSDAPEDVIEVIRAGARGYTYKEIARQLDISAKTVETHVSSVLRKLQLSNRHELSRWATERRIV